MIKPLLTAFLLCCAQALPAQIPNVLLDADDGSGYPPCEPSVAISRTNPQLIVAGSIIDKVYTSEDGGKTWETSRIKGRYGAFGDPCIISDEEGRFYYFHLSDPTGLHWESEYNLDRIVCQYSDNGHKWSKGAGIGYAHPKDQDKEWASIGPDGHIYVSWTEFDLYGSELPQHKSRILFSKSTDRGKKFCKPVVVSDREGDCLDDDYTPQGVVPAIAHDGTIHLSWAWNDTIWYDYSTDGGASWHNDRPVATQPTGWSVHIPGLNRTNTFPVTLIDRSGGPYDGTIYINYMDQRNGMDDTDNWLIKSGDGGNDWSTPIRINNDDPGKQQFLTWMAIDQKTGYLYSAFYDRRRYDDTKTDVVIAWSKDGGDTWQNALLSESPFVPIGEEFFGDYTNIDAHDNKIAVVWARQDNGIDKVLSAVFTLEELEKLPRL